MPRLSFENTLSPALLRRFKAEALGENGDGRYYGAILRDDGDLVVDHPETPALDPAQMMWTQDVLKRLNKELHHDGAWVVVFTHPKPVMLESVIHIAPNHVEFARYCLIWLDADGDPSFTMEWMENEGDLLDFADVLLAGVVSTMQKAEAAWEMWHEAMRQVLAPKKDQLFKRAQGQRAPSTRH